MFIFCLQVNIFYARSVSLSKMRKNAVYTKGNYSNYDKIFSDFCLSTFLHQERLLFTQ